jgi:hypothetical protein
MTTDLSPSQQLAAALRAEIPETMLASVIAKALSATMISRTGVVESDHKVRLQAAQLALFYQIGKPIERAQIITKDLTERDDPESQRERLRKSPALRRSLARMIDEVDSEASVIEE